MMEGMLENLTRGLGGRGGGGSWGINSSKNPDRSEVLNLKLHPRELRSSMFPSL